MSARAFSVFPGSCVSSVADTTCVLVSTGVMSLGLTVAEARELSVRIARAADDVEHQLSLRARLRLEHADQPRVRTFEQQMEHESGRPSTGPL